MDREREGGRVTRDTTVPIAHHLADMNRRVRRWRLVVAVLDAWIVAAVLLLLWAALGAR